MQGTFYVSLFILNLENVEMCHLRKKLTIIFLQVGENAYFCLVKTKLL